MIDYKTHVHPYSSKFIKVKIEDDMYLKAEKFAGDIVEQKMKEDHYRFDSGSMKKRFLTGTLGELALESILGKAIVNWDIGLSNTFNQADLKSIGIKAGIKSVNYGLFPVVFKNSYYPEIINIVYKNYVYVCGLATTEDINRYQAEELIKSPKLRARGTKAGFYGFEYLKTFNDLHELKTLTNH